MLLHKDGRGEGARTYRVATVHHHELRKTGAKKGKVFDAVARLITEVTEKMSLRDAHKVRFRKTGELYRSEEHKLFSVHIQDQYGRMF